MKNISIKNLTILAGILSALTLIFLFVLTNNNNFKQHEYQEIIQDIEEIDIDMLKLRRYEKDFLSRLDPKYVDKHKKMRPNITKLIDRIDVLALDVGETWKRDEIVRDFQSYYEYFDELVEQQYVIGFNEEEGLRGELRSAIHGVEKESNAQNDAQLLAHVLMLRRHEKDFFLRKQLKYLGRHSQQIATTGDYVKAKFSGNTERSMLSGLESYKTNFGKVVEAHEILGLDSESGIRGKMRGAVHSLEEVLEGEISRLKTVAKTEDKALADLTKIYFVIGSLLILAILSVMVWQLVVRSRQAMSVVDRLYTKVQTKDFSGLESLFVDGKDEFAILTRRTAQLGEQIGKMYDDMAQAGAAADRIKQALDAAKAPVLVCDDHLDIIYKNESFDLLVKKRQSAFQAANASFSNGQLLGNNIDQVMRSLGGVTSLSNLNTAQGLTLEFGGLTIEVNASAILNESRERLGIVLEWSDQTDILAKAVQEKQIADENAGIRVALDVCDTNVMIADNNYNISYLNNAVVDMMSKAESDLQRDLPNFDAGNLMGQNIDVFHKNPEHQRGMLEHLQDVYRGRITVGGRTFDLIATPMFNADKERLGTVVEWDDVTERLAKEAEEKRIANENASIKLALDVCDTNVMMADAEYNINYMNDAVQKMMRVAETDLREVLPNFDANRLVGSNIDVFHANPSHQRSMLAKLKDVYRTEIQVGKRTFALIATPIFNQEKERLGTVVEWNDRTAEVAIEKELNSLIVAANDGDLGQRMDLEGKEGFFRGVSEGLNSLLHGLEAFVSDMGDIFSAISRGDLSERVTHQYKGQFDQIKSDANGGIEKLSESLKRIQQAAFAVGSSSKEVAQGTDDLSRRTESQASSLEETASSMEEMTATVRQTADNAQDSAHLAKEAKQKAEQGGDVVKGAVTAMAEILKSSNQINDIIGVIDEIAFQTNLLALNAAVEAARAGEHGRGFAVVAGEVRTLSQRSAAAAKEIKDLIRDSVNKVESGSSLVNESGEVLNQIIASVDKVAAMIQDVNDAAAEQTSGISQINQAISAMDEMTQQNAALVEESSAASRSMSEEANSMNRMIDAFRF